MDRNERNKEEEEEGHIVSWESDVPLPPIPEANFAAFLLNVMSHHGEKKALMDARTHKHHTYNDVCALVPRVCANLAAAGVAAGDAVLLLSPNHIDFPIATLAIQLLPATSVPVNPAFTPEEVCHAIRVSGARWAVVEEGVVGVIDKAVTLLPPNTLRKVWVMGSPSPSSPPTHLSFSKLVRTQGNATPAAPPQNESFSSSKAVALMPFSSGTTGLPKGVMLSHRSLLTLCTQNKYLSDIGERIGGQRIAALVMSRVLLVLPLYHIYANTIHLTTFIHGGCLVLMPKFSLRGFLMAVQTHKITYTPLVPHIINYIVESPLVKQYDLSSLMAVACGASPLASSTIEAFADKMGKGMGQGYAMTETCVTVAVNSPRTGFKLGAVGRVLPYMEAKIVAPGGSSIGLPPGEEGEVWVRSPGIMLGYAYPPGSAPSAPVFKGKGWLPTGDLGYCDADGFLFLIDRIKDLIKVKSHQVSPSEVENVLKEVEGVGEVAVVGVPSPHLGEAPRAYIVPTPGKPAPSPHTLMEHVAARLAPFKRLAGGVEVVGVLPKNALGKVLRRRLREHYLKGVGGDGSSSSSIPSSKL